MQALPSQLIVEIPPGYEVAGVTGTSLDRSEPRQGGVALFLTDPALRRHQFLLSLERPQAAGSFRLRTELPSIPAAQRGRAVR